FDQLVGKLAETAAWHVDDERGVGWESALPFGRQLNLVLGVVRGGKDEFRCGAAIGERRLELGRDSERRGDARDDLEGQIVLGEEGDLLGGAAEDKRVAGFKPQNGPACAGVLEHQVVNAGLRDAWLPAALADINDLRRVLPCG